jgi:hypothetical protein
MSELKVNKISPRSGTDVTLGDSGDTITIPSGATLTVAGTIESTTGGVKFPDDSIQTTAVSTEIFTTTIGGSGGSSDWTGSDPYTAVMTVSGILSTDVPIVDINLSSVTFADVPDVQNDWALVYRVAATDDNELTFYATEEPVEDFTVQIQVVR